MKKLKSTLPNMAGVLTITTMIAGFLLGYVYRSTAEARDKASSDKLVGAISQVVSGFDNDPVSSKTTVTAGSSQITIYPATHDGRLIGCAAESSSDNGFSGKITIVAGFDPDGNILGYEVCRKYVMAPSEAVLRASRNARDDMVAAVMPSTSPPSLLTFSGREEGLRPITEREPVPRNQSFIFAPRPGVSACEVTS